jgi:transcriptional regulator with XRE-family HTH domain
MPENPIDSTVLYRNVVHLLEHGMRTATYKLATLTALVEFCVDHRPVRAGTEVEVPIGDLAQRVMALYWRQLTPFEGVHLRQSTQAPSRILDAVETVRRLTPHADVDMPAAAAHQAPLAYRRALDDISVCLARQPLPRLQRLPGPGKSLMFMYDDSFLHDRVTASELNRHNNAIRLRPGVANGLATLESRLTLALRAMWVDDVLRLNRISGGKRELLDRHLFKPLTADPGHTPNSRPTAPEVAYPRKVADGAVNGGLVTATFASRLNYLFTKQRSTEGQAYSSGEVAAGVRQRGILLTVSAVSQLRSGVGPAPSDQIVSALAKFFDVPPTYFVNGELSARLPSTTDSPPIAEKSTTSKIAEPESHSAISTPAVATHRLVLDEMDDIASLCAIRPDGCWLAPTNDTVQCRPRNTSDTSTTPIAVEMSLHDWAWMVDHGLTAHPIPADLVRVLRSCGQETCCNPQHLFTATHRGVELTPRDVKLLLDKTYGGPRDHRPAAALQKYQSAAKAVAAVGYQPLTPARKASRVEPTLPPIDRVPLEDSLESIAAYCTIDAAGCWVIPKTASVPCRATGDDRPMSDLPKIAPHRWAWMVSNSRASNPLRSDLFQVWKNCGNRRCCNPKHLYLTNPDGEESSAEDADEWIRSAEIQEDKAVDTAAQLQADNSYLSSQSGRHRARHTMDDEGEHDGSTLIVPRVGDATATGNVIADRLNSLFETQLQSDGTRYSSADVASVLQEDGLAVSADSIDRIRRGSISTANNMTVDALAYFFNVDANYFSARTYSAATNTSPAAAAESQPAGALPPQGQQATTTTRAQVISISVADLGRSVTGMAEAISECLARNPADLDRTSRLALVLNDVGTLLTLPPGRNSIGRPLLRRIVTEWSAVGHISHARQSILPRLVNLLDEN